MTTIFEAMTRAALELKDSSRGQNPKLDAQVLLAFCLGKPTSYLFAHGDEGLSITTAEQYHELIERRARHEPVAYLVGEKEFHNLAFTVNKHTLIPRPETELLVDETAREVGQDTLVIDVGTGSGAIAVSLAASGAEEVIAIDSSAEALAVAEQNAERHAVNERIAFLQGNLLKPFFKVFESWKPEKRPRAIVIAANLPYLTEVDWALLEPDVKNFEPKTALVGGTDGLMYYDELLMQLAARRKELPRVVTLFEIDPGQKNASQSLLKHYFPNAKCEIILDFAGRARILRASV